MAIVGMKDIKVKTPDLYLDQVLIPRPKDYFNNEVVCQE